VRQLVLDRFENRFTWAEQMFLTGEFLQAPGSQSRRQGLIKIFGGVLC
jgi:hypothetical protein